MINLTRKLKKEDNPEGGHRRAMIRDRLLVREIQTMEHDMPKNCSVFFRDPNCLSQFTLTIKPDEGFYRNGTFRFMISVPEEYNMTPPKVKCLTRLFHPNITEDGDICLSLLRENSIDGLGWAPTRQLNDVIWGLNSLFTELLNFEDPLNKDASEQYERDKKEFENRVRDYIYKYARS